MAERAEFKSIFAEEFAQMVDLEEQNADLSAALAAMAEAAQDTAMWDAFDLGPCWCDYEHNAESTPHVGYCLKMRAALADPTTTAAYAAARQAQDVVGRVREAIERCNERGDFGSVEYLQKLLGPDGEQAGEDV